MIFVIILWIIGIVFCSFLFLLFLGFLCDKYDKRKLKRAEEETAELIRICTEPDVDKMISLLEKGLDPNTKVKRTHEVYASDDDYDFHPDIETVYEPLIVVAQYNKPIQDLLVAYGAKTMEELKAEERAKAVKAAERFEAERLARVLARDAKKAADIDKVKAHLLLKAKKA